MKNKAKIIKYPNAPSGMVKFYKYKEPFMKNKEPYFGYQGVLLHDAEQDLIQCSYCGKWFKMLTFHIKREHNLTTRRYKDLFGLQISTALINESIRAKLIENGLNNVKKGNLPKRTIEDLKEMGKRSRYNYRFSMEMKNKFGSCPEQILNRLKLIYKKLGRQPSYNEAKKIDSSLVKLAEKTYGSWNRTIELLGWKKQELGVGFGQKSWTADKLIKVLQDFKVRYKRKPMSSDARRGLLPSMTLYHKKFGGLREAREIAFGPEIYNN